MASGFASATAAPPTPSAVTDQFNRINDCIRHVREATNLINRVADDSFGPVPEKMADNPRGVNPITSNTTASVNDLEDACRQLNVQVARFFER